MEIVDTMVSKEVIGVQTRRERRAYSEQFKAQVIQACKQPGASIAAIALSNDINPNVLHRWLREHAREGRYNAPAFLPVNVVDVMPSGQVPDHAHLATPISTPIKERVDASAGEIAIECVRGHSKVTIRWPLKAAADCGLWLKDWLA